MNCLIRILAVLIVMAELAVVSAEEKKTLDQTGLSEAVWLDEPALNESSGLAVSGLKDFHFWSHNDSGGRPHLFAFDRHGKKTGQVDLESSCQAVDWEDMASFVDDGVPRLLIADCGDNEAVRPSVTLYLFDEPDPAKTGRDEKVQSISVTYSDGPRDCEAVAVDVQRRQIVMITKTLTSVSGVYLLPLPQCTDESAHHTETAQRVGNLPLPMATGMDLDAETGDIWVVNYLLAYRFKCPNRTCSIADQLSLLPLPRELPRWRQIEAIGLDQQGHPWITSEGKRTPLGRLSDDR